MSEKVLLRHYIGKRLAEYYSQPSEKVVGSILGKGIKQRRPSDIAFMTPVVKFLFWGKWHWDLYNSLYKRQSGQWLTPVELFAPFYSQIIANFIATEMNRSISFDVVELGGGQGTNAIICLLSLQKYFPQLYSKLDTYYIVESSQALLESQRQQLLSLNRHDIIDKVQFLNIDISQAAESDEYVL